jgi:MFS family permease
VYFYAYIIFQIPAGVILDRYDSKWVISGAMFLCVLGNFLFSVSPNYEVAIFGRVLMGVGSAFGFIGAAKLASMWLPPRFFSAFIGFATILGVMGGFVTDSILNSLVMDLGWRNGNNVFTYIGVVLFILMLIFIKDNREHFNTNENRSFRKQMKELLVLAKSAKFWSAGILSGTLFIPINVLASLWGVGFIESKLGVTHITAAYLNSLLFIGNAVGCVIFSVISTYTTRYRFLLVLSCIFLTIFSLLAIYVPMNLWVFSVVYFMIGLSVGPQLLTFGLGNAIASKGATGTAVAGINMICNFVGSVLLPLFGWILVFESVHHIAGASYTLNEYYYAMSMIPILTLLSIPICMVLPKHINI